MYRDGSEGVEELSVEERSDERRAKREETSYSKVNLGIKRVILFFSSTLFSSVFSRYSTFIPFVLGINLHPSLGADCNSGTTASGWLGFHALERRLWLWARHARSRIRGRTTSPTSPGWGYSPDGCVSFLKTYERSNVQCAGPEEGSKEHTVFIVEAGATLQNVSIGVDQREGVYCTAHDCTIANVWWADVCEDALTIKGGSAAARATPRTRSCSTTGRAPS